jgi:hypothetical protein
MDISNFLGEKRKHIFFFFSAVLIIFFHSLPLAIPCTPFSPGQYSPSLYIDSLGNPHVAWEQILPHGPYCNQNDIYYTHSTDQGESFLPATADIDRFDFDQARVSLAVDKNGNPAVIWADTREGIKYIYFSKSYDGGNTFTPGIRIDTSSEHQDRPSLLFDSKGNPMIVWIKVYYLAPNMNPVGYLYFTKSTDGGRTFLPSVCVYGNSSPYQGWPSATIDSNNNPLIATHYYRVDKQSWNAYFIKSIDQGASFEDPVIVEPSFSDQLVSGKDVLVVDSYDNPYLVFMDKRSGHWNIRLARSLDGGSSFKPSRLIDSSVSHQLTPSLGIDADDILYIVWGDIKSGIQNIYFTMSEDGGSTFRQSIVVDQKTTLQNRPSLYVDFNLGIPHVAWSDIRQGRNYIYYSKSIDNGISFLPSTPVYEYPPLE